MNKFTLRANRGFTLIELLVVIAIIGILVAIAIPQFAVYRRRGFDSDVRSNVKNLSITQEAYFADKYTYASGPGDDTEFSSRGFKQSPNVGITSAGTAGGYLITATAQSGCNGGTGVWSFDSLTGTMSGTECG